MKMPRTFCLLSCLVASGGFAAGLPGNLLLRPVEGREAGPNRLEVFEAFHTKMFRTDRSVPPKIPIRPGAAVFPTEFRSIDGTGNNQIDPLLGAANTPLLRTTTVAYGDGAGTPAGANRKGPREISNLVIAQAALLPNARSITDFVWQWGQFLDHDMSLTTIAVPTERFNIPVPSGDPQFDPGGTGTRTLPFQRSAFVLVNGVREQINVNSAFIDGSQVYGSDDARAQELRLLDGSGKLKTSDNNLLPFNTNGFPNQPDTTAGFFLAGDVRVNEQPGLTALQTIFMHEHNFWADKVKADNPTLDDDGIYFRARAIVGAEIQAITYRDFIPLLLGKNNPLTPYVGYNPNVNPGIANAFSTAAFRVGHTMLSPNLMRLDANNVSTGDLSLRISFFKPAQITGPGIEPYLRGLAKQRPQEVDGFLIDEVRNANGFDLASLNIQRGRDHGLPGYNQVRIDYGLPAFTSFAQMTSDVNLQAKLASAYATVDDVDSWVGLLAEKHTGGGSLVSETISVVLKDQFQRLRDGDRFWYQTYLDPTTVQSIERLQLSTIVRRNSTITTELQRKVFVLPPTP